MSGKEVKGMKRWYEQNYRRNLIDMHVEEWDARFLSWLDPDQYLEALQRAGVQTAMLYANSHVGVCYWPTEHGRQHAGLQGRDFLGQMLERCRAAGISAVVYFTLVYDNACYARHPQWRNVNEYGKNTRQQEDSALFLGPRYGTVCVNSKDYRAYAKTLLAELMERYDFDGFFLDMTFWPVVCTCNACRRRYAREMGREIPDTIDWDDPCWTDFQDKREEWMQEFALDMTGFIQSRRPELTVEHQYSSALFSWRRGVTEGNAEASDYAGGDLYGGLAEQAFACKLYRNLSQSQPFEYMTSRCDPGLGCHTRNKSAQRLAQHAFVTYAHHGAFLFIDAIDPDGTIHTRNYDVMRKIYERTIPCEPWFKGTPMRDAAIYFSMKSKFDPGSSGKPVAVPEDVERYPHLDAALGAAEAFRRDNVLYDVVSKRNLSGLKDVRLLVVPALYRMDSQEAGTVIRFVEEGGALYVSGCPRSRRLMDFLGLEYLGDTAESFTYIEPVENTLGLFAGAEPGAPLTVEGPQCLAAVQGECQVLARIVLPYTDPADPSRFASIHSNPPGRATEYPAVVWARRGRGQILWVSAPVEKYRDADSCGFFLETADFLIKDRRLRTNAPAPVELTAFEDGDRYILHLVDQQEYEPPVMPSDIAVNLCTDGRSVTGIRRIPEGTPVAFEEKDGWAGFRVPGLDLHAMYEIAVQKEEKGD